MRAVPLTQGKVALVDDEDYERVMAEGAWHASRRGDKWYAVKHLHRPQRGSLYLHRFTVSAPPDKDVDHINGNSLDNQKANLRLCTMTQNQGNRGKDRDRTTSHFKGVYRHTQCARWAAQIRINGKLKYLGLFVSEEEAARAYDQRAPEVFGPFARLNFPSEA